MISKSIQEANKKYFMKNPKAKMLWQKIHQTDKQLEMLLTKRDIQVAELFTFIK